MIELGCVSTLFSLSHIIWLDDRRRPLSTDLQADELPFPGRDLESPGDQGTSQEPGDDL